MANTVIINTIIVNIKIRELQCFSLSAPYVYKYIPQPKKNAIKLNGANVKSVDILLKI